MNAKQAIAQLHVDLVGYDPFVDDPAEGHEPMTDVELYAYSLYFLSEMKD